MTNGEKFKKVFGFGADGSRVIAVNAMWWDCQFQDSKPFTNADRIRSMSDEELAYLLVHSPFMIEKNALNWLKQEAE